MIAVLSNYVSIMKLFSTFSLLASTNKLFRTNFQYNSATHHHFCNREVQAIQGFDFEIPGKVNTDIIHAGA